MAKKVVYNSRNRRNPSRKTNHANPYASDSATDALVNALLQQPDLEEILQAKQSSKTSATKKPPAAKEVSKKKKKSHQSQEKLPEVPEGNDDDEENGVVVKRGRQTKQNQATDIEESELEVSEDEEESVQAFAPKSSKNNAHRRETSVNSISTTDSSEKNKNVCGNKDQRRQKSSPPPANDRGNSKVLEDYKEQLDKANKTSQKRHQKIDDLEAENDELQQKIDELEQEKHRANQAIRMITQNPSVLHKISGSKRQTSVQQGDDNYDDDDDDDDDKDNNNYDDNEDDNDDDEEPQENVKPTTKSMVTEGKIAIKKAYRTFKFICTNLQETQFCELVMDNIGIKNLTYMDNDSEERKAEVAKNRKKFKQTYQSFWVSYLNKHRSYTQVSDETFTILTVTRISDQ